MKRRSLLAGGLLGGLATVLGVKGVATRPDPVDLPKPLTIPPNTVVSLMPGENIVPLDTTSRSSFAPMAWTDDIYEMRVQAVMERMRQTPWYQSYMDQRVMENLGIPAPNLITHRYVTYPMMGEIANRGGYSIEHVEREIAKSLT